MIEYKLASSTWGCEEYEAIDSVVKSGNFTMGEKVKEFEEQFAKYVGSKYCVMVNSGSSANLLAVASLFYCTNNSLKYGDEVIVPAVSWSTTYFPLYQYGLKLKFVDVDINTLNIDIVSLREAITDKTKAIMLVNVLGNPNQFDEIKKLVARTNIILIEDNCESLGAIYQSKQAGTFGRLGTFSSYFSHHINTMEGGMVVTNDEELYQITLSLRTHGWTRGLPKNNLVCGELADDPFYESFRFILPGYNFRPLEMSGAIGLEQLLKLPRFISNRRKNAEVFMNMMRKHQYFKVQREIEQSSWFGFSMIIDDDAPFDRQQVVSAFNKANIETRPVLAGNFVKNPVVKWLDCEVQNDLSNSNKIHENGLYVGNHHFDLSKELGYLDEVLDAL